MLRKTLDKVHPLVAKGGKFERLYPLYEALDTFFYTPSDRTSGRTHVRDALDMKRMMIMVVVALIPCVYMAFWNTGYQANLAIQNEGAQAWGWQGSLFSALGFEHDPESWLSNVVYGGLFFLPVYIVTLAAGGTCELIFALIRGHEINEGFLVTSLLYALILPPTVPLWMAAMGIIFGVVVGKEMFGGTGRNFLNPALTSRVFLYFAFPFAMAGDAIWVAAEAPNAPAEGVVQGYTAATALGAVPIAPQSTLDADGYSARSTAVMESVDFTWTEAFLGTIPGSMGETSTLCVLFGAVVLIVTGVGNWRIMGSMVGAALVFAAFLNAVGSDTNTAFYLPAHWHLVVGSLAFGAVFMATDPVSSAMTRTGMWFYGALIGVLTVIIRVINPAFPEGVNLAILFGNVFAPLIDYAVVQANIKRRLARNVVA